MTFYFVCGLCSAVTPSPPPRSPPPLKPPRYPPPRPRFLLRVPVPSSTQLTPSHSFPLRNSPPLPPTPLTPSPLTTPPSTCVAHSPLSPSTPSAVPSVCPSNCSARTGAQGQSILSPQHVGFYSNLPSAKACANRCLRSPGATIFEFTLSGQGSFCGVQGLGRSSSAPSFHSHPLKDSLSGALGCTSPTQGCFYKRVLHHLPTSSPALDGSLLHSPLG